MVSPKRVAERKKNGKKKKGRGRKGKERKGTERKGKGREGEEGKKRRKWLNPELGAHFWWDGGVGWERTFRGTAPGPLGGHVSWDGGLRWERAFLGTAGSVGNASFSGGRGPLAEHFSRAGGIG